MAEQTSLGAATIGKPEQADGKQCRNHRINFHREGSYR
jgi:hypothetical protein